MFSTFRSFLFRSMGLASLLIVAASFSACSLFQSDDSDGSKKHGWMSLPFGGSSKVTDATPYLEYQRKQSNEGGEAMLTLFVRNTHSSKTIDGQMRTTMTINPGDMKVDSQNFTLGPNEQKRLLIYPARYPLTYEVTAAFR
jgi:hypothetical protein